MADLLPCPFCGGTDVTWHGPTCTKSTPYDASHRAFPIVRCRCGVQVWGSDWDQSGASAIANWNRRPATKTSLDHFIDDVEAAEKAERATLIAALKEAAILLSAVAPFMEQRGSSDYTAGAKRVNAVLAAMKGEQP